MSMKAFGCYCLELVVFFWYLKSDIFVPVHEICKQHEAFDLKNLRDLRRNKLSYSIELFFGIKVDKT